MTDSLTEYSYDADLAGLTYQFAAHNLGLFVTLSGYNDKLNVLAKVVFEKARNLTVSPERLHVVKSSVRMHYVVGPLSHQFVCHRLSEIGRTSL